ncbi:hypothetical protein B0H17DRAFT_1330572 [Mycena rosella]|uniref:Uncharacterized protein n=1 Tax=Mycena rosella TaxID=1033263 RepID=A0AAD7DJQ8_MYCRO|nr:hypothetical protein B0H17DRAFT_1330572 [Mycena rosella]
MHRNGAAHSFYTPAKRPKRLGRTSNTGTPTPTRGRGLRVRVRVRLLFSVSTVTALKIKYARLEQGCTLVWGDRRESGTHTQSVLLRGLTYALYPWSSVPDHDRCAADPQRFQCCATTPPDSIQVEYGRDACAESGIRMSERRRPTSVEPLRLHAALLARRCTSRTAPPALVRKEFERGIRFTVLGATEHLATMAASRARRLGAGYADMPKMRYPRTGSARLRPSHSTASSVRPLAVCGAPSATSAFTPPPPVLDPDAEIRARL